MSARAMVADEAAGDRLMRYIAWQSPATPLTRQQVAQVLSALADHTALTVALEYRRDDNPMWPEARSLGRWLHAVADDLRDSSTYDDGQGTGMEEG